jgi:hypothetical protein
MPRHLRVKCRPWQGFFYRLEDHDRLVRDGWTVHAGDPVYGRKSAAQGELVVYRKPVSGGTRSACLEMTAVSKAKIAYALRDDIGCFVDLMADWADVRGDDVFYSQGGKLLRMRVRKSGEQMEGGPEVELGDFTEMKFEPIEAPAWATKW